MGESPQEKDLDEEDLTLLLSFAHRMSHSKD